MTKMEEGRRIVARAITFIDNKVLLIERYRKEGDELLHYFTIPGGGVEDNETYEEAAIRETKEETGCDILIKKDLISEDYPKGRCYWFFAEYLDGTPMLGGEELVRNNPDNSYNIALIDYDDLENINILGKGKELIRDCWENEYQNKK